MAVPSVRYVCPVLVLNLHFHQLLFAAARWFCIPPMPAFESLFNCHFAQGDSESPDGATRAKVSFARSSSNASTSPSFDLATWPLLFPFPVRPELGRVGPPLRHFLSWLQEVGRHLGRIPSGAAFVVALVVALGGSLSRVALVVVLVLVLVVVLVAVRDVVYLSWQ